MPPPPPPPPLPPPKSLPPPPPIAANSDTGSTSSKEKVYATFSAQFPPPEWLWYQQQIEKQKRTQNWVTQQVKASAGTGVTCRPPTGARGPSARKSLMALNQQPHMEYMPMSAINHMAERKLASGDGTNEVALTHKAHLRSDNLYDGHRHYPSSSRQRHHRKTHESHRTKGSEYDVIDPSDVTPMLDSHPYHSVSGLSPVAADDERSYVKLIEHPKLGPLHSTPRCESHHHADRNTYGIDGHEAKDRIHGPSDASQKRRSRRSRRRTNRGYSIYGSGNDISYEYKGYLPKKNSSRVQSRDSGVNCVGTAAANADKENKRKENGVYENMPRDSKEQKNHTLAAPFLPPPGEANCVQFEFHSTAIGESNLDPQTSCVTDPAFNSLAYQSSILDPEAYNSVVYGSMGGPSVVYHTMAGSSLEQSAIPPTAYQSLQSGYYDERSLAQVTCQVDVNSCGVEELHASPDSVEIDVVGLTDSQEAESNSEGDEEADGFVQNVEMTGSVELGQCNVTARENVNGEEKIEGQPEARSEDKSETSNPSASSSGKSAGGKDSGFSSPRILSTKVDPVLQTGTDCLQPHHVHQASSSSETTAPGPQDIATDSSGSQAHSDVHMASGGEQPLSELITQEMGHQALSLQIKSSQSLQCLRGPGPQIQNQHLIHHLPQRLPGSGLPPAVSHTDVYNNNAVNACHTMGRAPLHPSAMMNAQRPLVGSGRSKRSDRPRSEALWKTSAPNDLPSDLHQFEEEQLAKKYGANGEFEVMGVL